MTTLIKATNLCVGYGTDKVLSDLNFEVTQGDYLCVIGSNGVGKSTLIKTMLGFLPKVSGTLDINLPTTDIGYLAQQSDIQRSFPASVEEVVLTGRLSKSFKPFYNKEDKLIATESMTTMQVLDLRKKSFRTLSGGQQQRVLLSRLLCGEKKVLILDEPITGLDPTMTQIMYDSIEQLHKDGITIIMISHDMNATTRYATHILKLGNNTYFGTKEDYLSKGGVC